MKFYFSITLCVGIMSCMCLAAPATDGDVDDGGLTEKGTYIDVHECYGQYLKGKGKLAYFVPTGNSPPEMCRDLLRDIIPTARENFENKAKELLPNEVVCLMTEFDKGEAVDSLIFKTKFYKTHRSLSSSEKEAHYESIATEARNLLSAMESTCGIGEEKFATFLQNVNLSSRSKPVSAPV